MVRSAIPARAPRVSEAILLRQMPDDVSDAHDDADFPEVSRRRRLAELFVLLKGHDIRIVANSEHYEYPLGATPLEGRCTFDRLRLTEAMTSWPRWQVSAYHLVVAFAPPRGEYEEDQVTVPF